MELLHYVFFFLVTLGVLVTFHEAGHFFVARWVGVHVVRFSVGFGKPLVSWRDKRGTEFCVAMLPLGGYVRMYDRRDADADDLESKDPALASRSYDQLKHPWRILILLGGPAANFLLALLCYWSIAVAGTAIVVPVVGAVEQNTPAQQGGLRSGEEIVAIDGRITPSWNDVALALAAHLGETGSIEVRTRQNGATRTHLLGVREWLRGETDPDPIEALGIRISQGAVVGKVLSAEPGALAGLAAGDRITHVNDEAIPTWGKLVEVVRTSANARLRVTVRRGDSVLGLSITPRQADRGMHGYIGVAPARPPTRVVRHGAVEAFQRAAADTWANTMLTVRLIGKMLTLDVSPRNLAGPITIAKVAGDSASLGVVRFLYLLALLSISLGVINLLPIPILDGGQVVSTVVEMARGKPLSAAAQAMGTRVGIAMVGCLMLLAFYSDATRWFWPG